MTIVEHIPLVYKEALMAAAKREELNIAKFSTFCHPDKGFILGFDKKAEVIILVCAGAECHTIVQGIKPTPEVIEELRGIKENPEGGEIKESDDFYIHPKCHPEGGLEVYYDGDINRLSCLCKTCSDVVFSFEVEKEPPVSDDQTLLN